MAFLESTVPGLVSYAVLRLVAASFVLYLAGLAVYRLLLSSIAGFPGPKLAALTQWYEFYYNAVLPGQFFLHIETMHDRYRPIIRINPWELHIRGPDFYETIYSATARRDKAPANQWQRNPGSIVNTVDHDFHKWRRRALNPYFGKRQLQHFRSFVQSRADRICERLAEEYAGKGKVLNWSNVWACYAGDNVMKYCFAITEDFPSLPDFKVPLIHTLENSLHIFPYIFYFPWLLPLMKSLPESVIKILSPNVISIFQYEKEVTSQILATQSGKNQAHKDDLISQFLRSCSTLISHPAILTKMQEELLLAILYPATIPALAEQVALSHSSIRFSYGKVFRLPRTSPDGPIQYGPYAIPSATPVSIGHYSVHYNETLLPDSHSFIPERLLDNPKAPLLNIMPPSINHRNSGSANLEPETDMISTLIPLSKTWRVEIKLFETGPQAVDVKIDRFVPGPEKGSKGVRFVVETME